MTSEHASTVGSKTDTEWGPRGRKAEALKEGPRRAGVHVFGKATRHSLGLVTG
jgi:hypothetical protein